MTPRFAIVASRGPGREAWVVGSYYTDMKRRTVIGISVTSIPFLIVGIAWFAREHRKALDAQCIYNLRCIDGAKQQWALEHRTDEAYSSNAVPTTEDIHNYNSRNQYPMPVCPRGGTYTIGRIAESPTCSFPGHVLTEETAKWSEKFDIHGSYPEH